MSVPDCVVKNCRYPVTSFPIEIKLTYGDFKVLHLEPPLCLDHQEIIAGIVNKQFNSLHELADVISIV